VPHPPNGSTPSTDTPTLDLDALREQHPTTIEHALAHGEVPLADGRWQHPDGRVVDPQLGDGAVVWRNIIALWSFPVLGAILLPILLLTSGVTWLGVGCALGLWVATGLSITAGYHRLFSHRAYKAAWPVRLFFAIFGAMTVQNSILHWAKDHRYHHGMVDTIGDPYDARRGWGFSHIAWMYRSGAHADDLSNVDDLLNDPIVRWQDRYYVPLAFGANFAVVGLLAAVTGLWFEMFVLAGVLRIAFVHHVTFFINSWAHQIGNRPWSRKHTARDSWLLSLLTFGEGYHNYHHTFARDYRNGVRWYHFDPSKWTIWTLGKLGLAHDLKRIPLEVTLHARMAEQRQGLGERLMAAGHGRLEAWMEQLEASRSQLSQGIEHRRAQVSASFAEQRDALGLRLLEAEHAAEEALQELRRQRKAFSRQQSARMRSAERAARHEVAQLRRSVDQAQREALRRWAELRAVVTEVEAKLEPVRVRS